MNAKPTSAFHVLAVAAVAALAAFATRAQDLQVIELQHRLAEDVMPVVRPLLEEGGVLTGADGVLFVRTSPANLEQIRRAVESIDRAPRQLLITVGQGTVTSSNSAAAQGAAVIGDQAGAALRAGTRSREAALHDVSSVSTLEGNETYISVGQSGPYREADTGFYAIARVSGDSVVLEIAPRQQRLAGPGGVVHGSGAATTVSARLGEWIELGAVRESSSASTGGLLVWGRHSGASEYSAWVKVEEVR